METTLRCSHDICQARITGGLLRGFCNHRSLLEILGGSGGGDEAWWARIGHHTLSYGVAPSSGPARTTLENSLREESTPESKRFQALSQLGHARPLQR